MMRRYANIFWELFVTDLIILKQTIVDLLIDTIIWVGSSSYVISYVFPSLGMDPSYGAFYLVGCIASLSIFEIFAKVSNFVADLDGDKVISYHLTLPVPSWLVFAQQACTQATYTGILGLIVLPLGKIILQERLSFDFFSPIKFFLIFIALNLLAASFALFTACMVKNMSKILHVWTRMIYPLWFFGGSQFSWHAVYKVSPWLGYCCLLNPFMYVQEGVRATIIPHASSFNFWVCLAVAGIWTVLFFLIALKKLRKRLDFI